MRNLVKISSILGIILLNLFVTRPVLAFPQLPSSFYGTVKDNGVNVPDGTLVKASMNGKVYSEAKTQTYQGDSVYSLDIPGDDSSTTVIEGGQDGDTIVFTIEGNTAGQTGIWKSGTITNLNLSVSAIAPQKMAPPTKTKNAINTVVQPTATPTLHTQPTPTRAVPAQVSPTPTKLLQPTPKIPTATKQHTLATPTAKRQITLAIPTITKSRNNSAGSNKNLITIGIVVAVLILVITLWLIFIRKPTV